jgi:hypothetical protein
MALSPANGGASKVLRLKILQVQGKVGRTDARSGLGQPAWASPPQVHPPPQGHDHVLADEEDKANAKYDAICGKNKQNTGGGSGNNGNQGGRNNNYYSGPNRKRKPDNTVAAIQRPAKENSKKNSGSFKDLLKEKCSWHLDGNHTTE